ncbi:MAG: zinc ribbon domain-containing protein [Clostridia bacterium]|nr:zinc ribbon domain-containing protein [Clostridia bacterium]
MGALLYAMILGIIPGMIARKKGRSFLGWYIYGVLLFIIALPHSLIMKSRYQCPYCMSNIDPKAVVCPKCARDIGQEDNLLNEAE